MQSLEAVKEAISLPSVSSTEFVSGDMLRSIDTSREQQARAILRAVERKRSDDPIKICVLVRVRRLFDLSLADESFTAMLHVITCWACEGDAARDQVSEDFVKEHGGQFVHDADPELAFYEPDFRPRIAIRHLHAGKAVLDGEGGEDFFYRTYVDGKTIVTWEAEKLCVIGSLFDLCYYPVDVQALDICLELKTSLRETQFVPFPADATISTSTTEDLAQVLTSHINLPDYAFIPGHEYTGMLYTTLPEESWTGEVFSGVKVSVWFQRRFQNDLYNLALVQFAITSLVSGVWAIDIVADRIAPDFTLVLAGVTMKFVVAQKLPPVSYVTMMEKYINMTFGFLVVATALHCLQAQHSENLEISDMQMFWTWLATWVVANIVFSLHAIRVRSREVDLVRQLGLTRTADAGSGEQMLKTMTEGEGQEYLINQGMGGITDVRAMLKRQKQMAQRRAQLLAKRKREERLAKARRGLRKAEATSAFNNPIRASMQQDPED